MLKLDSASQLFLTIVLHDMIRVTCFAQPQIWVTREARYPTIYIYLYDRLQYHFDPLHFFAWVVAVSK